MSRVLSRMAQFAVTVKVVECEIEPDVASTVIVAVTGWWGDPPEPPVPPVPPEPDPPPLQAVKRLSPAALTASNRSAWKRLRFFQPRQQRQQSVAANSEAGKSRLILR